ncbi:unnamed protein product [Rodentolepis nana]|uniref:histone acetyltransferase n=1 Tax=Rodentolepis nana TaxID=102285 RepID=A0A0R3TPP3_RODNA|nr:unnamed protein product [Rodentolepis nana]
MPKRKYEKDTAEFANASKRRRLQRRPSSRFSVDLDASPQQSEPEQYHSAMEGQAAENTNVALGTPNSRRSRFGIITRSEISSCPSEQTQVVNNDLEKESTIHVPEIIVISSDSEVNGPPVSSRTRSRVRRARRRRASRVPQDTETTPEAPQRSQGSLMENTLPPEANQESSVLNSQLQSDSMAPEVLRLSEPLMEPPQTQESESTIPCVGMTSPVLPEQSEMIPGSSRDRQNLIESEVTPTASNPGPSIRKRKARKRAPLSPLSLQRAALAQLAKKTSCKRLLELLEQFNASWNAAREISGNMENGEGVPGCDLTGKSRLEIVDMFANIVFTIFMASSAIYTDLEAGSNPLRTYRSEILDLLENIVKFPFAPFTDGCSNKLWDALEKLHEILLKESSTLYDMVDNNIAYEEERIKCSRCRREWHKYCALHVKEFEKTAFICPPCRQKLGICTTPNLYDSARWPKCELSQFIERKVNEFLESKEVPYSEVIIRVLSDSTSKYELNANANLKFYETARSFNYREKGIFAFQKCSDSNYVCFFGFYVQEYGQDSAEPNRDRVYLSYLDSVPYFKPKNLRTGVYHEILCAYMEYVKMLNFKAVHLWASPPVDDIEYIFNNHPPSQRMPNVARLVQWYKSMVDQAIERGIVLRDYTLKEYVTKYCNMPPTCLPYFKGDHWPNRVVEIMKVSTLTPLLW